MESLSFQSVIKPLALSIDSKVELTFLMSILEVRTSTPHYNGGQTQVYLVAGVSGL